MSQSRQVKAWQLSLLQQWEALPYKHSKNNPTLSGRLVKDSCDQESEPGYKFECAVCDFKKDSYSKFYDQIEFTHEDESESDGTESEMEWN